MKANAVDAESETAVHGLNKVRWSQSESRNVHAEKSEEQDTIFSRK